MYNKGKPIIDPRFARAKIITEHEQPEGPAIFYEYSSIFNVHHVVKDVVVDPDTVLVFELQGKRQSKLIFFRPEDFDIYNKSGTGYDLWRDRDNDDGIDLDMKSTVYEDETLAWSVLDLFN